MSTQLTDLDRRTALRIIGLSGLGSLAGATGGASARSDRASGSDEHPNENRHFENRPVIEIPVIDAYYEDEKVWFIHTSASTEMMAERLTEMINYPTLHTPAVDEAADLDEVRPIYVFKNGIDRSDADPWGGGPFGKQIDILDTVPDDPGYTPLRRPHVVKWKGDATPRILTSESELRAAESANELDIMPTDMVVTAPVVSWPGDPFPPRQWAIGNPSKEDEGD